jgi:hypothetical protein
MPTSQYTIERCRRGLLSTGQARAFEIREKDRRIKFFSTFITVVDSGDLFESFVFASAETVPSWVIAV